MKSLFLVFILFAGITFSQDLKKIQKKFQIENCGESDYLIVERKGKSGIYNKQNQAFDIPLSESQFYFFDYLDLLIEFSPDKGLLIHNIFNADFPNRYLKSRSNDYFSLQIGTYYENRPGDYYLGLGKLHEEDPKTGRPKIIEDSTTIVTPKIRDIPGHHQRTFGIERTGDLLIVTNLCNDIYDPNPVPYLSVLYPGEDSINDLGDVVYPPNDKGFQKSGVLNLKTNEWLIQPEYFRILLLNDVLFCNKQDSFNDEIYFPGYGHWDIFRIENNQPKLIQSNVSWASEIPLEDIFDDGQFEFIQKDSSYIQFEQNGLKGLMRLSLFYNTDYLNPGEPAYSSLNLYHDTLLQAEYNFIGNIGDDGLDPKYFLYNENGITYVNLEDDRVLTNVQGKNKMSIRKYGDDKQSWDDFTYWIIDDKTYTVSSDSLIYYSSTIQRPSDRLLERKSIEIINDSLIYLEYWIKQGTYWEPVYDIDYNYKVNEDGEQLYYPPDPGEFETGVFNLNSNEWFYDREYAWISACPDKFRLCYPDLDSTGYYTTYLFRIDDLNRNVIEEEIKPNDLKMPFKDAFPKYKVDSVYSISGIVPHFYGYFEYQGDMGVYYKGYPEILMEPRDYAYYNNDFNFYFSIEDDSCFVNFYAFEHNTHLKDIAKLSILPATKMDPYKGDLFLELDKGKNCQIIHLKDSESYVQMGFDRDEYRNFYFQEIAHQNWAFSVNRLNDSLIYIEDWTADENIKDVPPLMSELYPGEDSLDANGEWVYPPLEPGYNRSGIYNFKSKSWWLERSYYKIEFAEDQLLLRKPVLKKDGLIDYYQFKIINLNNEVIWSGDDYNELPDESPFFKILVDD